MYELAKNPLIQNKVYEEIKITIKQYGSLCYDAIIKMEYLDRVIQGIL